MKKLTVALLVMLFMAFSLTGCGQKCDDCGKSKVFGVKQIEWDTETGGDEWADGKTVNMCKKCREARIEALIEEAFKILEDMP